MAGGGRDSYIPSHGRPILDAAPHPHRIREQCRLPSHAVPSRVRVQPCGRSIYPPRFIARKRGCLAERMNREHGWIGTGRGLPTAAPSHHVRYSGPIRSRLKRKTIGVSGRRYCARVARLFDCGGIGPLLLGWEGESLRSTWCGATARIGLALWSCSCTSLVVTRRYEHHATPNGCVGPA
jgi:hypothetical protein